MQSLRECKLSEAFWSIHSDVYKSAIALFLGELLYKVIREEEANTGLFEFLYHSICFIGQMDRGMPISFIFYGSLSKYLGFLPLDNQDDCRYFDIKTGAFAL